MPIELGIWRLGDTLEPVPFSSIETETKLEDALVTNLSILSPSLLLIGRQVPTAHGKYIDLLAMDADGNLSVIELKRNRTPREVVAQVLDYASWAQDLAYKDIAAIYTEKNPGKALEQGYAEKFDGSPPEKLNQEHQLVVVASELDPGTERIISYLSENYGVPINAVFFRHFKDGDSEYLTRTWLIDPNEAETRGDRTPGKQGKETWNGTDFYVSFGEDDWRNWGDARKYGFISAGGGKWYTQTLSQLFEGARVFVMIPKVGYVGVGTVMEGSVPVKDFSVQMDDRSRPILEAPLKAQKMGENADDPDMSEYVVRVKWQTTLPRDQAHWEKGMFANQNSVCKLRNKFTLERLKARFALED